MTARRPLPGTDLSVFPLCLGGNVFGFTAEEQEGFRILDAYAAAGGNFVDTADVYTAWLPPHTGGESETIIGNWMASRGNRDSIVVATKVGMLQQLHGLSAGNVRKAVEESLRRLRTDYIDVYYAHEDDPETPLGETVAVFDELVREGKVRYPAASNYSADRLDEALRVADGAGQARFAALQPHYNLVHRDEYEGALAALCEREGLGCVPYYGLASGFLTGKYRPGADVDSPRARAAAKHLDERGLRVLAALDATAAAHATSVAAVGLAWLLTRPAVVSVIASVSRPDQLTDLLALQDVVLTADELAALEAASA